MADSDKDILITPNVSQTSQPEIKMVGKDNSPMYLKVLDDNTLSFEGAEGQAFSISPTMSTGTIFSVNDISGVPSITVDANGTITLAPYQDGNIGIGMTSPTAALHITSPDTATEAFRVDVTDTDSTADSTPFVVDGNGRVGIGTASPLTDMALTLNGDGTTYEGLAFQSGGSTKWKLSTDGSAWYHDSQVNTLDYNIRLRDSTGTYQIFHMNADTAGELKVGIGTTSPQGNLHVVGATGDAGTIYLSDADDGTGTGDSLLITKSGDHAYIYNRNSSGDLRLGAGDNSGWLTIADDGKVGIGDTNPLGAKLHVEQANDTTVYANTNETFRYTMLLRNNTVATNAFSGIAFDVSTESDFDSLSASIAAIRDTSAGATAGNHDANLAFATNDAGDDGLTERMRITHDGNVGIGTTSPSTALEVSGTLTVGNAALESNQFRINNTGGYAAVELGGSSGAYIDMKTPFSDDFDGRIITDGNGLDIIMSGAGRDIRLMTNGTERFKVEDTVVTSSVGLTVNGSITVADNIIHSGDTNNTISFGTDTQSFNTGSTSRMNISDSGLQVGTGARVTTILDEDNMASDSATALATQQSIKAYVDANAGGGSPAGSDSQIQYNNGGSFGGDADFTWDDTNNRLVIGSIASQHDALGKLTVKGTDASFLLEKHDDSASGGPSMTLYRYSATEADGDLIGQVVFRGEGSTGNPSTYMMLRAEIEDTTEGTKDGALIIRGLVNNSQTNMAEFNAAGLTLSQGSYNTGNVSKDANTVSGSSLANGSSVTLFTVPVTTRAFKATIFFKDTSNTEYQIEEIMGYNTGSSVDFTSFGQVYSGAAAIGSLDASNSSGTTLIKFTNAQGSAINYQATISVTHMDLS